MAAYAVIVRDEQILLSRLAPHLSRNELWTLPGGGVEHGEDPRDAVVREVHEETGLAVSVSEAARVHNFHQADTWRAGRRVDAHSIRIVYDGWVPPDSPDPHVVEVDGSTVDAAWHPVPGVLDGSVPVASLVTEAMVEHLSRRAPARLQRVAAYAVLLSPDGERVLLTRISPRGFHAGLWTLPGGGIDHGESPRDALVREVREECGLECAVGEVLDVDDVAVVGAAPSGRQEDFHGVHLVFAAAVSPGPPQGEPRVVEVGGTTDAVEWVSLRSVADGSVPVLDVVRAGLAAQERRGC